jgi:hypothetical protein
MADIGSERKDLALSELVRDFDLYPREQLDHVNVRDLVRSIKVGDGPNIPPIVVDQRLRIIDGFHRREAWVQVHGEDHVVPVIVNHYPDEAAAFTDAVRRNTAHGVSLTSSDRIRAAARLQEMGVGERVIVMALRITEPQVVKLQARIVVDRQSGESVPLKAGDVHLQGQSISPEVRAALKSRSVNTYSHLARQIRDGARLGILPDDETLRKLLLDLVEALQEHLGR